MYNKKRKGWKVSLIIGLVLACLGGSYWYFFMNTEVIIEKRFAKVEIGNIVVSVEGTGAIKPYHDMTLVAPGNDQIQEVFVKDGDVVQAGQPLMQLNALNVLADLSQVKSSSTLAERNYAVTQKSIDGLTVKAPFDGIVQSLDIATGADVSKNGVLLNLVDDHEFKITLPFSTSDRNVLQNAKSVDVFISNFMESIPGKIVSISKFPYATEAGGDLIDVTISVRNPGALNESMNANVSVTDGKQEVYSQKDGNLQFANKTTLRSESGGTVASLMVQLRDRVKKGQSLVVLENELLRNDQFQLKSKLEDAVRQKDEKQKLVNSYQIVAPYDGVVTKLMVKSGDAVKTGDALVNVFDPMDMEMDIMIDELDVAKLEVGMPVDVSLDALSETEDEPLEGEVVEIAMQGESTNGVTTYPVTIAIEPYEALKTGMNANASIILDYKEGIKLLPLEAVTRSRNNSYVFTQTNPISTNKPTQVDENGEVLTNSNLQSIIGTNTDYYAGTILKPIVTGAVNDTYVEVISGLEVENQVILPPLAAANQITQPKNALNGFGGLGGGGAGGGGGNNNFGNISTNQSGGNKQTKQNGNSNKSGGKQ